MLEVTESAADAATASEAIEVLCASSRSSGVWIAIDDFGTGYSSLSQLEQLPVDVLKVDRGWPAGAGGGRARTRAAAGGGRDRPLLQLRTVVEGIETPEQLDEAEQLHFPFAQGFVFARPMSADAGDRAAARAAAVQRDRGWTRARGPCYNLLQSEAGQSHIQRRPPRPRRRGRPCAARLLVLAI